MRCLAGYERFDTPAQVDWLNNLYEVYDDYVNLFQPTRKPISKERHGSTIRKRYDTAKTPLQRAFDMAAASQDSMDRFTQLKQSLNLLALHRQIEALVAQ